MKKRLQQKACLFILIIGLAAFGGRKNFQESLPILLSQGGTSGVIRTINPKIAVYTYTVAGKTYQGALPTGSASSAHHPGDTVKVYYERKKPSNSVTYSPGNYLLSVIVALIVLSAVFFSGELLSRYYKDKPALNTPEQQALSSQRPNRLAEAGAAPLSSRSIKWLANLTLMIGLAAVMLLGAFLTLLFGAGIFTAPAVGWKIVSAILFLIFAAISLFFIRLAFGIIRDICRGKRTLNAVPDKPET